MLKHRLIFGPIMIALLLGVLYVDDWLDELSIQGTIFETLFFGRDYLPAGLIMLLLTLGAISWCMHELSAMFDAKGVEIDYASLWAAALVGGTLIYIIPYRLDSQTTIGIYASFMVGLFLLPLLRYGMYRRTQGAILAASVTMFAFIYVGVLPGFYLAIRREHSAWTVAAIILITKSADIGAYFTGRVIGRHKLIPWLSPGKTWEGMVGGVVFSAAVAMGFAALGQAAGIEGPRVQGVARPEVFSLGFAAVAGTLFGILGQVGDLAASMFKRDAGVKDSGRTIPGFGGAIDVLDSAIVVGPFAYWLLALR